MARSIKCPHCGQVIKAGEEAAGKRVNCPACKKAFLAPKALATPPKPTGGPPPVGKAGRVWHLHVDGRNDGPFSADAVIEQIKTGKIGAHSLAWKEGMDDWVELGKLEEFRGALSTPPPVGKQTTRFAATKGGQEKDQEHRPHYVRGKGKVEVMVGIWVAAGLAAVALIVILVVASRQEPLAPSPPPPPLLPPQPVVPYPGEVPPGTKGTVKVIHGPRDVRPTTKTVVREESNEKLLTKLATDLTEGFKGAIEAHKNGDRNRILLFGLKCKGYAEKVGSRKWGGHQSDIDTFVLRLKQAAEGIEKEARDSSRDAWDLGDGGLTPEQRAKALDLNKFEWLESWRKILTDEIEKLRQKGLAF